MSFESFSKQNSDSQHNYLSKSIFRLNVDFPTKSSEQTLLARAQYSFGDFMNTAQSIKGSFKLQTVQ